jgi:hypothetical protein
VVGCVVMALSVTSRTPHRSRCKPDLRRFWRFENFLRDSSLKPGAKRVDLACVTTYPVDSMK